MGTVMIADDEKVIFAGGWNAKEADGETTVNPFTTYEVGSCTKQITAAARPEELTQSLSRRIRITGIMADASAVPETTMP